MAVFYKAINIRDTIMNAEPQEDKNLYEEKYKIPLTHFHSTYNAVIDALYPAINKKAPFMTILSLSRERF